MKDKICEMTGVGNQSLSTCEVDVRFKNDAAEAVNMYFDPLPRVVVCLEMSIIN